MIIIYNIPGDRNCLCDWDVGEHCEECETMYAMTLSEVDDDTDE